MQPTERPALALLVADSGRTWLVMYDEIGRIPPSELELGDVLIVRHPTELGVMAMQAVRRNAAGAWDLEALQLEALCPT